MVFVFFTYFTIEPLVLIILKFGIPATLYHKLRHFDDPAPLTVPYETAKLYVEPCALLSPLAASSFYDICHKIPMRLGPFAVDHALAHHEKHERGLDDDGLEDLLLDHPDLKRRSWPLQTSATFLRKKVLEEAGKDFAEFCRKHPDGAPPPEKNEDLEKYGMKKVLTGKSSKAAALAGDLYRSLHFTPPKSHLLLSVIMALILLLPPLIRSIAIREAIVVCSVVVETVDIAMMDRLWKAVEVVDKVIPGGSEALFLWTSMTSVLSFILTLAAVLTMSDKSKMTQAERVRRAIGQRLDVAQGDGLPPSSSSSSSNEDKEKSPGDDDDDDVRKFQRESSEDSLDGFIQAGQSQCRNQV